MLGKLSLMLWFGRAYMSYHLNGIGRLLHLHEEHLKYSCSTTFTTSNERDDKGVFCHRYIFNVYMAECYSCKRDQ